MSCPTSPRPTEGQDYWYGCPVDMMWTAEELADEERRRCHICRRVCASKVHRAYDKVLGGGVWVRNYCSRACWESD